jgi:Lon protease-like protein
MISMICPFSINEKQMLLESKNVNILTKTVMALLEASINENLNYEAIN